MQAKCVPIFHSVESNQYILILVDPQIRILNYTKKKKWRISSQIPKIDLVDIFIVLWSLKIVLNCYVNEYIGINMKCQRSTQNLCVYECLCDNVFVGQNWLMMICVLRSDKVDTLWYSTWLERGVSTWPMTQIYR